MNSKLEEKLLQYQIANKQELLHSIESILKEEELKKTSEQDIDLIDEAVDAILALNGIDSDELDLQANTLINKILDEANVNSVAAKPKKVKAIRIKWLMPVAVMLSLLISATLVAYAMGYDVLSMTSQTFKQLKEKIWYSDDNKSIVISDDNRRYSSYDEMIKNEGFENLLWPSEIDDSNYVGDICITDLGECKQIACGFDIQTEKIEYSVRIPFDYPAIDQESVTIGNFNVYIYELENSYQADLNYMGNVYTILSDDYEIMEDFIKTLEEK